MFAYLITIISFCLDVLLSKYIPIFNNNSSLLIPMFTLSSLIITLPYFNNKNKNYLKYCIIFGFVYDIAITNTLPFNTLLFFLIGYIIIYIDEYISHTFLSNIIKLVIILFIYDLLNYLILLAIGYIEYNILNFVFKFLKSTILNLIYIIIVYNLTNYISKKFRIKKTS